jgi:hypothetical protein
MMKNKLTSACLMAAGLILSGAASATPWSWSGTLAEWAAAGAGSGQILDGDGDVMFKLYPTTTLPDGIGNYVTLSEFSIGARDYYDVGVSWDASTGFGSGYAGSDKLEYGIMINGVAADLITATSFDTVVAGTGLVAQMSLLDLPAATVFVSLSSVDGGNTPVSSYLDFSPRTQIGVQNNFQPSLDGVYLDAHNSFVVAIPEPTSVSLLGIGVLGLFLTRRRRS